MVIDIIGLILAVSTILILRRYKNISLASWMVTGIIFLISYGFIYLEGNNNHAVMFAVFIPMFSIFLLGIRWGLVVAIVYELMIMSIMFEYIGMVNTAVFSVTSIVNISVSIIILILLTRYYEVSRQEVFDALNVSLNSEKRQKEILDEKTRQLEEALSKLNDYKENLEEKVQEAVVERGLKDKLLVQQSKMASMGEMMSSIAHQWKQPLSTIGMIVNNLKMNALINEKEVDHKLDSEIDNIQQQVGFMTQTIKDFSGFFKPNKKKELFNLLKSINDAALLLSAELYTAGIEIVTTVDDKNIEVNGFRNEFLQVLLNIINNAKDAIVLQVKEGHLKQGEGKIYITITQDSAHTQLTISDNGGGIPSEVLPKIFDPYFTTKSNDNGTGIGLYMSSLIIKENMNAQLLVSNNQEGALFTIRLDR